MKSKERRPPAFAARAADAQKMLQIQKDPRFLELQAALQAEHASGAQGGSGAWSGSRSGAQTARPNFMGTLETKASWKQHFYAGLRMLIETVNMSLDPKMAEKQLEEAYRWYLSSKQPGGTCKAGNLGPDFHDFCADEVLRHPAQPGQVTATRRFGPLCLVQQTRINPLGTNRYGKRQFFKQRPEKSGEYELLRWKKMYRTWRHLTVKNS